MHKPVDFCGRGRRALKLSHAREITILRFSSFVLAVLPGSGQRGKFTHGRKSPGLTVVRLQLGLDMCFFLRCRLRSLHPDGCFGRSSWYREDGYRAGVTINLAVVNCAGG